MVPLIWHQIKHSIRTAAFDRNRSGFRIVLERKQIKIVFFDLILMTVIHDDQTRLVAAENSILDNGRRRISRRIECGLVMSTV